MSRLAVVVALGVLTLALVVAGRTPPETPAERVDRIASEIRCPVCQGLSVSDSPSETARQMRDVITQRVNSGASDDAIRDEFRAAYGDWVVLQPPLLGLSGLVWLAPLALVIGGILVALRFARRAPPPVNAPVPDATATAALRARVARAEAEDA